MSKLFWKRHDDAYDEADKARGISRENEVNDQHPLPVQLAWRVGDEEWQPVEEGHPLPVQVVADGEPWETPLHTIPGIGTGAAYASGDAFGTGFWITVPKKGYLDSLTFVDLDNEGLAKTVYFFRTEVTTTADNAAFAPTTADLSGSKPLQVNLTAGDFVTFSANQLATVTSIGLPYEAPAGRLWVRVVTRGADNIAAGAIPLISFGGSTRR